jgi:hypothetical protein
MTLPAPVASPGLAELRAAATAAGLTVLSSACWPEEEDAGEVTPLPGFIESAFSPLIAEAGGRALGRRGRPRADDTIIAIVLVTARGDVTSAVRVATAVDTGRRVPPLLFYQSVPNAVAGYLAARWHLTGPVVCVSGVRAAVEAAALLIDDADADESLVVSVDLAAAGDTRDRAAAILVARATTSDL